MTSSPPGEQARGHGTARPAPPEGQGRGRAGGQGTGRRAELAAHGLCLHSVLTLSELLDALVRQAGSATRCAAMCARPSASLISPASSRGVAFEPPRSRVGYLGHLPVAPGARGAHGAGAVTAKTCTPAPRRGHRNPTAVDWGHGLINAMGLPNPGAEEEVGLLEEAAAAGPARGAADRQHLGRHRRGASPRAPRSSPGPSLP